MYIVISYTSFVSPYSLRNLVMQHRHINLFSSDQ